MSGPIFPLTEKRVYENVTSAHVMLIKPETETENAKLNSILEKFWSLESIGVNPKETDISETFSNEIKKIITTTFAFLSRNIIKIT